MIPIAMLEALPALVKIGGVVLPWISGERQKELRQRWAALIQRPAETNAARAKKAAEIRQYLADRLQDNGRTPLYEWVVCIDVPLGLVTDAIDLLIDRKSTRAEQGLFGALFAGSPKAQRREWARTVKLVTSEDEPDTEVIVRKFAELVADAGRSAYYTVRSDRLGVDLGMLADIGESLIG